MKRTSQLIFAIIALNFLACSKDGEVKKGIMEEVPTSEENLAILTAGKTKVWKIRSATLANNSGSIDISENFNIQDDEFVFTFTNTTGKSAGGLMEWRQGNSVETTATTPKESEEDYYRAPLKFQFVLGDNPDEIIISGNETTYAFKNAKIVTDANGESNFSTSIENQNGATLEVSTSEKKPEDYPTIPSNILQFTEAFTFESNSISCCAPGMVGSYSDNSFFIVNREDALRRSEDNFTPERIQKFDLNSGDVTEKLFYLRDFVTKQVHIIDNKLRVVGGQAVNTYETDIINDPIRDPHGLRLSRSGTSVLDDKIYIVGGDLDNEVGDKIFVWNEDTKSLEEVATMPEPRSGARSEIINNTLYIFGGTEEFFTPPAKSTIYIYDFETEEFMTESLPKPIDLTYTGKFENLIYVAGREIIYETNEDDTQVVVDNEPFLGVYDTNTGDFTQLETNLESPGYETIHGLAVFNKKLFILYGAQDNAQEADTQTWNVLTADL